jgi:biotin carboxyl carrier protein
MKFTVSGREYDVQPQGDAIIVDGETFQVRVEDGTGQRVVYVNGVAYRVKLPEEPSNQMSVEVELRPYEVAYEGALRGGAPKRAPAKKKVAAAKGAVVAAMTGRVLRIEVSEGQTIAEGDLLLILEAMKMENEVRSPQAGTVKQVAVEPGARVNEGDVLIVIDDA